MSLPMPPFHSALVKESWLKVMCDKRHMVELFYYRLFELDPSLKILFRSNPLELHQKVIVLLDTVMGKLDNPEQIIPLLQALGSRHRQYGVTEEHYATVREAMLWALGVELGKAFTREARDAWATAYEMMAGIMKAAAREMG